MALKHSALALIVLGALLSVVEGKGQLCYSCITQGGDETCLVNPAAVPGGVVRCKYDYCTIRRLEDPNVPGVVTSFLRGCEGKENVLPDGENASPDLIVWAWKCATDLCNTGDGLKPPSSGGNGGTGEGPYLVPGSKASPAPFGNNFLLLSSVFTSLLLYIFSL